MGLCHLRCLLFIEWFDVLFVCFFGSTSREVLLVVLHLFCVLVFTLFSAVNDFFFLYLPSFSRFFSFSINLIVVISVMIDSIIVIVLCRLGQYN